MTAEKCYVCGKLANERRLLGTSFLESGGTTDIYIGLCSEHTMEDVAALQRENPYSWLERPHEEIGNE